MQETNMVKPKRKGVEHKEGAADSGTQYNRVTPMYLDVSDYRDTPGTHNLMT